MKTYVTCLTVLLAMGSVQAQTEPAKPGPWLATVEMGVQTGRVRPDQPTSYYGGYYPNYVYYPQYPISSQRPAGNRIGLTIHAFMGYRLQTRLVPGVAFGVDYYNNSAFFPVAAALQGTIFNRNRRLAPFYTVESGYAFRGPNPHDRELTGGWLWSPGVGLRINKGNGTGFLISMGYKHQEANQVASVDGVQTLSQIEYRHYNRLYFRMGFSF